MPIDVKRFLEERASLACAGYHPLAEFGNANMSLNVSMLARWPDMKASYRQQHVREWYQKLRERMDLDMMRVFGDQDVTELRGLYVREALESAIRHLTTGPDPTEQTEAQAFFAKALRARAVQILRILVELDRDLEPSLNLPQITSGGEWLQCAWGQHGAHWPDGIPV
jgi:hypothetical protein